MTYTNLTNEELVGIITETGENAAYEQLFRNLHPVILHEAAMYIGKMETYSLEDLIQECRITCWEVISRGNWTPEKGKFSTYYGGAVRNKLIRIFRDYNLKNLACIGEQEDYYGNISRIYVESDYAKEYRRKKAEQQKRWYEKKKAAEPPKEPKPKKTPETKEERSRRVMAYQKEYYAAHPDKLAERREKNRIRERERRAAKKAAKLAALAEAQALAAMATA